VYNLLGCERSEHPKANYTTHLLSRAASFLSPITKRPLNPLNGQYAKALPIRSAVPGRRAPAVFLL
jgi:hypothetical protein